MATKEGTLKWFNEGTGYGLIRPDDGGRSSSCAAGTWRSMGANPSRKALR